MIVNNEYTDQCFEDIDNIDSVTLYFVWLLREAPQLQNSNVPLQIWYQSDLFSSVKKLYM